MKPLHLLRIECGLEADIMNADLREEVIDHADQMTQIQVAVRHEQLHLMELRQVRGIHGLVAEDAIDGEVLDGLESLGVLRGLVQHLGGDRRSVGAENVLHGFLAVPLVSVSKRTKSTFGVNLRDVLEVVFGHRQRRGRIADEEGILGITSGMTLRLEQRIEVPERRLDKLVGGHLVEAHLQQDFAELGTDQ